MWTTETFSKVEGKPLKVMRLPGASASLPHYHFAHATGFNANTYKQLLEPLQKHANIWAWDMRGHGGSGQVNKPLKSWTPYYKDFDALLNYIGEPIVLAGHSIGGMCSAAAAAHSESGQVRGLLLLDPVLILDKSVYAMRAAALINQTHRHPLAQGAARRREVFPSRELAFRAYRGRGIFKPWPESWLRDYLEAGLIETDKGFTLACTRAFESASFAASERWAEKRIKGIHCPITLLAAETNSTMTPSSENRFKKMYPNARFERVVSTTHMVPMERPELVQDHSLKLLKQVEK